MKVMTKPLLKKPPLSKGKEKHDYTKNKFKKRLQVTWYILIGASVALVIAFCVRQLHDYFISPVLASADQNTVVFRHLDCSNDYEKDRQHFPGCAPLLCGRGVIDGMVRPEEVQQLLAVVKRGMKYGGSNGGASILDLNSGALSKGNEFINIFSVLGNNTAAFLSTEDMTLYNSITSRILDFLRSQLGLHTPPQPTYPTFFSRMTSKPAITQHDEYWHEHVDRTTYPAFHFTSLLYLTTYGHDFQGGRFFFVDNGTQSDTIIEPRAGRISYFTSGHENRHYVEKVKNGTRYALTIAFSCDPKFARSELKPKL